MSEILKIKIDNREIWMEASTEAAEDVPKRVSAEGVSGKALDVSEEMHEAIRAYCASLAQGFQDMPGEIKPKKIKVEFGLKLSADAKFYVVNAKGEASVGITAEWELT